MYEELIWAIDKFKENESFLLENNINERAITHTLAEYIKELFPDMDVDCEYNRMLDSRDEMKFIKKQLDLSSEEVCSDSNNAVTVYPDIVVHKRWNNESNILIVEVKKKNFAFQKNKNWETYKDFDMRKIEWYMRELNYQYWLYIEFDWTGYDTEYFPKD